MKKLICCIVLVLLMANGTWAEEPAGISSTQLVKTGKAWDGKDLPAYPGGKPEITILRIVVPAGMQLPLHTHPVINAGILLKGKLTVITENNQVLHLGAGDPIVEVVNTWHYGKNEGTEPAEIVVFYAGVADAPITVKK